MLLLVPLLLGLQACGGSGSASEAQSPREIERKAQPPRDAPGPLLPWTAETRSPEPDTADPELGFCGEPDAALARAARGIAERDARGAKQVDAAELALALRAAGSPHVHPRTWQLSGNRERLRDASERLARYLPPVEPGATRRCGVGRVSGPRGRVSIAVVLVDALADLAPVPTFARLGRWIQFDATLLAHAEEPRLVVLGPSGEPRTVPTSTSRGHARATFSVDREGAWTAQLLARTESGPLPLLEAMVFVETEPPAGLETLPAPGEAEATAGRDAADSILRMANAARMSEGRAPLRAHAGLDEVARAHASAMRRTQRLGHDVGDGTPKDRLRRANMEPRVTGENVAHALTLEHAHRALWASPSHRGNLLDRRFRDVGIGVAEDADGSVWVCQLLAGFVGTGIDQHSRP